MVKQAADVRQNVRRQAQLLSFGSVYRNIQVAMKVNRPVFIWGPPGVGKSALLQKLAQENGLNYIDLRMSLLNPVDLRGVPFCDPKELVARWLAPCFLPNQPKNLVNFDELNLAPPVVQAAAYQLILDRRCGEYQFPEETYVFGCGNRTEDQANVFDMAAPLRNRMIHLEMGANHQDWKNWAITFGVNAWVLAFLASRPDALFQFERKTHHRNFPTPRSWHMVSDICNEIAGKEKRVEDVNEEKLSEVRALIEGCIGEGMAQEFIAYTRVANELPDLESIIQGEKPEPPKKPDALYALSTGLVYLLNSRFPQKEGKKGTAEGDTKDKVESVLNVLDYLTNSGMSKEFGVVTSTDLATTPVWTDISTKKEFTGSKVVSQWVEKIGKLSFGG